MVDNIMGSQLLQQHKGILDTITFQLHHCVIYFELSYFISCFLKKQVQVQEQQYGVYTLIIHSFPLFTFSDLCCV